MKSLTLHEEYILLAVFHLGDNAYLITLREHLKEKTGKDKITDKVQKCETG